MRPSDLIRFKQKGQPIAVLTAWDSLSAALAEAAGADVLLIGDSLAMVALGHATTLPVSLEQMLHHTQAVARGLTTMPADQQHICTGGFGQSRREAVPSGEHGDGLALLLEVGQIRRTHAASEPLVGSLLAFGRFGPMRL